MSDKINALKSDEFEFKQMTTPCSVFMSFENEEGYKRALKLDEAVENDSSLEHL